MERLRNPTRHTKLWIGVREADLLMKWLKCESCKHEGEMYLPLLLSFPLLHWNVVNQVIFLLN